jgi:hypothetical protein
MSTPPSIEELLERIRATPGCEVEPPAGQPALPPGLALPADLHAFYMHCGGAVLYREADYVSKVTHPSEFVPSNHAILGEGNTGDRSDLWYTVVATLDGDYISIDLAPERKGRCYDSFHEVHGLIGESRIVAVSFSDLLRRLLDNEGSEWYWLSSTFEDLGDAYDDPPAHPSSSE